MPLKVLTRADDSEKHEWDINCLLYTSGKLYSGADDGKIKVKPLLFTNIPNLFTKLVPVLEQRFKAAQRRSSASLFGIQHHRRQKPPLLLLQRRNGKSLRFKHPRRERNAAKRRSDGIHASHLPRRAFIRQRQPRIRENLQRQ